jgi:hypothetical protein
MARPESDPSLAVAEKPRPQPKADVEGIRRKRAVTVRRRRLAVDALIRTLQATAAAICLTEVVLALLDRQHPHASEVTGAAFIAVMIIEWIRFSALGPTPGGASAKEVQTGEGANPLD